MVKRLIHLVLFAALIFTLYPIIYTLSMSMSGADEIRLGLVYLYPKGITLETYKLIISSGDMWKAYGNSILISAGVVMVALIITMPAAYALSVKTFFIKAALTKYFMVTLFFGGGIIPLFLLIIKIGLYNSLWAVILPSATGAWFLLISRVYIESTIPQSLYECAKIEGCNDIQIFGMIVLPLSKSVMAVIAIFCSVGLWNSYFMPLIFLPGRNLQPLSLYLRSLLMTELAMMEGLIIDEQQQIKRIAFGLRYRYAAIIVSTLPIMAIYPFLQKYFIKGVTIGAVKG